MNSSFISIRILFILPFIFGSIFALGQPFPEPILHLQLEGNANDASGNGWHGILEGDVSFFDGKVGLAANFNRFTSKIRLSPDFELPDTFTVAAWIRPVSTSHEWQALFSKRSNERHIFWLGLHKAKASFWLSSDDYFDSDFEIQENEWAHICWVGIKNNSERMTVYVYKNCIIDDEDGVSMPLIDNPQGELVLIGLQEDNGGNDVWGYGGLIDEFLVYDKALSQEEICRIVPTKDLNLDGQTAVAEPNPNLGIFTLQFGKEISSPLFVSIFNTLGTEVDHRRVEKGTSSLSFDLSGQVGGIYFLTIKDEEGTSLRSLKILFQ